MKIISWNVNGIRAIMNKDFDKSTQEMEWDILCIQETKAQNSDVEKVISSLGEFYYYCNSAEKKGYSGTAIISKIEPINVEYDMGVKEHDTEGRIICAEYPNYYLVNVYVPNSGQGLKRLDYREQWDRDFLLYLKEKEKQKPLIVCGDFNVAHRPIDLKNDKANYNKTAGYTQVEIDGMDNFIHAGFRDTFRLLHPDEEAYSYWSYRFKARERNVGWRIDYFLLSEVLLPQLQSAGILPQYYGSDHCPVTLEVNS